MGIALYQAVRNPAWVKYSRLEEDTNAREILDSMATEGRKANVRSLESFCDDDRMDWGDCTF